MEVRPPPSVQHLLYHGQAAFQLVSRSRGEAVNFPAVSISSPHPPGGFQIRILQSPVTSLRLRLGGLEGACRCSQTVPLTFKYSFTQQSGYEDGLLCFLASSHLITTAH